jgi:hypothetical protein
MSWGKCTGKRKYATAPHARREMRRATESGRILGECSPYPCKACGGWHWGRVSDSRQAKASQTIAAIDRALTRDQAKRNEPGK